MKILSILIPTTPERKQMFESLYNKLLLQKEYCEFTHPALGECEILYDDSKRFLDGGLSIGKKREALLQRAVGRYLCFLDSDDNISPNYIETLLRLCFQGKDICTFQSIAKIRPFWCVIDMSLKYQFNEQTTPDYLVRRKPWHVCPVRSEYAKQYAFENINWGEDWQWFEKVLSHCLFEAKTNAILHEYIHGDHSESDKIMNSNV